MAVGIFRKISENISSMLKSFKDYVPTLLKIAKVAAPVISTVVGAPGVGAAISAGANALENLLSGKPATIDPKLFSDGGKIIPDNISSDVSPFIKFKRTI